VGGIAKALESKMKAEIARTAEGERELSGDLFVHTRCMNQRWGVESHAAATAGDDGRRGGFGRSCITTVTWASGMTPGRGGAR